MSLATSWVLIFLHLVWMHTARFALAIHFVLIIKVFIPDPACAIAAYESAVDTTQAEAARTLYTINLSCILSKARPSYLLSTLGILTRCEIVEDSQTGIRTGRAIVQFEDRRQVPTLTKDNSSCKTGIKRATSIPNWTLRISRKAYNFLFAYIMAGTRRSV